MSRVYLLIQIFVLFKYIKGVKDIIFGNVNVLLKIPLEIILIIDLVSSG